MLTKPKKSAQPDKLTVSIMPTLPSLHAMPANLCAMLTDLACYAYITNKEQPLNYSFVVGLKPTLDMQKTEKSIS